jgi:hypothetical protein
VYALGATLYFALTGHIPTDALERSLGEALADPQALNPAITPHVAQAVTAALAVYPDQRPSAVADFRAILGGQAVVQPQQWPPASQPAVQPPAPGYPVQPPALDPPPAAPNRPANNPWLYALLVLGVLVVFAIVTWAGLQGMGRRQPVAGPSSEMTAPGPAPTQLFAAGLDGSGSAVLVSPTALSLIQPSQTPLPAEPPPSPTLEPSPTPTIPSGRIIEVLFCDRPCGEAGAQHLQRFPEAVTRIDFAFRYTDMQPGTRYTRRWFHQELGQEWVRYDCTWQGPKDGVFYGRLREPEGLRSGTWVIEIEVAGQAAFQEVVFVEGSHDLWTPAGPLECADW